MNLNLVKDKIYKGKYMFPFIFLINKFHNA